VESSIGDLRAQLALLPPSGEAEEVRQRVEACEAYRQSWTEGVRCGAPEPSDAERLAVVSEVLLLTQRVMELRPFPPHFDSAPTERVLPYNWANPTAGAIGPRSNNAGGSDLRTIAGPSPRINTASHVDPRGPGKA